MEKYISLYGDILTDTDTESGTYVTCVDGIEGMNRLFQYRLQIYTQTPLKPALDATYLPLCFHIQPMNGQPARYYHGHIRRIKLLGHYFNEYYRYEIELAPWFWWLTQNKESRIFPLESPTSSCTVLDVLKEIFKRHDCRDYDISGVDKRHLEKSDFWMQYQESDYDFIRRLLFNAGIFFYFRHDENGHHLVFGNESRAYTQGPKDTTLLYAPNHNAHPRVVSWIHEQQFVPGKFTVGSHEYKYPKHDETNLTPYHQDAKSQLCLRMQYHYEQYHVVGGREHEQDPNQLNEQHAKAMTQAADAKFDVVTASSLNTVHLAAGECLQLDKESFSMEEAHDYVITDLIFRVFDERFPPGLSQFDSVHAIAPLQTEDLALINWQTEGPAGYWNTFKCIESSKVASPACFEEPKRPRLGLQEAVIKGPMNCDIFTDELGRYRIQFVWDRMPKFTSCLAWVRALESYGIYRVGTPVLIDFIRDDPNQPVIIGPILDGERKSAQNLPYEGNVTRFQARSYDLKEEDYSRMEINDREREQLLRLFAAKDMQFNVNENMTVTVKEGTCVIDVKGKTVIRSADDLELEGKQIILKAEGKIMGYATKFEEYDPKK